MKRNGYYECFERVEKARMATPINTNELEAIRDFYGFDLYSECLRDVIKKHYSEESTLKSKQFHFDNITKGINGAQPQEGDFIESVSFDGKIQFDDGWTVTKQNGKLGIIWGYKKEFTPFEHFASRCIFTIREETAPDLPDFNSPEAFFCEPD